MLAETQTDVYRDNLTVVLTDKKVKFLKKGMAKFDKLGYIVPNLSTWITYDEEDGEVDHLAE